MSCMVEVLRLAIRGLRTLSNNGWHRPYPMSLLGLAGGRRYVQASAKSVAAVYWQFS